MIIDYIIFIFSIYFLYWFVGFCIWLCGLDDHGRIFPPLKWNLFWLFIVLAKVREAYKEEKNDSKW